MDRRERHRIELDDDGEPRLTGAVGFTPRFTRQFGVHGQLPCTVCHCPVDDHWQRLRDDTDHEAHVGCTGALLRRVAELERQLEAVKS